ncbi:NYN domain-containing protein [Kineococcus sp. SYSU DK002]|uniref:NYN domain-containing protein n=1 Tax=Kineococcus sp. SYSU DK002 TaxID=3383123 RepID=UPI003D7CEE6B
MDAPRPHEPVRSSSERSPDRPPERPTERREAERRDLDLLVWDAPNIDMTLSSILGSRPASSDRPRFDAIARWFLSEAGDHEVEGCVFTNVHPASAVSLRGWIEALRSFGYAVFARPKVLPEDDVDDAMLQHIASRRASHRLRRVVVASGDGRNFLAPLEELHRAGVRVVVLSFAEVAGYAQESPHIEFVDLEDVPGAFQVTLGRTRLTALPPDGGWFRPTRPMRALLEDSAPLEQPASPPEAPAAAAEGLARTAPDAPPGPEDAPRPAAPEVGEVGRAPVAHPQRARSA